MTADTGPHARTDAHRRAGLTACVRSIIGGSVEMDDPPHWD